MIKNVLPLSLIIALRFLGLFIVLPVISLYALHLGGANEILVGIAIGGYALTQMFFQVPFGILSDKIGRKPTIIVGLFIFAAGSIICALATDIYTLIFGRFLQGAGALGAVAIAMISDIVREEQRAKAMTIVGITIAATFTLSMFLGPFIGGKYGVDKLFWLTAIFSFIALFIVVFKVSKPPIVKHNYEDEKVDLKRILLDRNILRMNLTNFLQKGMMTMAFLIIPIHMVNNFSWAKAELWKVYLPAMIIGVIVMAPSAILGEKKHKSREMLGVGVVLFAISYLTMCFASSVGVFILGTVIFFAGFNIHEPLMQSMASKYAKVHQKGAALGVFNTCGYIGTFLGGTLGGYMLRHHGLGFVAWSVVLVCIGWIFAIRGLENPGLNKILYQSLDDVNLNNLVKLEKVKGVIEFYINETERILVIKYDSNTLDENRVKIILEAK